MPIKTPNNEKKVKKDPQKYVYQGSPYNAYKTHNNKKNIIKKQTLRNTFIRDPPYNAYKNPK